MATAAVEKFEVRNRWTDLVQFTAEIECAPDTPLSWKLRLAVLWARSSGSNLSGSNLSGSNLSGSDLSGSNLSGSNLSGSDLSGSNLSGSNLRGSNLSGSDLSGSDLSGSNLSGSNLSGSNLRSFKADFFMTLLHAQHEVPALVSALREGRVNGSQYEGDCACLVGTLANAQGADYRSAFPDHNSRNPAERWFLMINEGDKPGDDTGGGFAAEKALEWALEFLALTGADKAAEVQA